MAAKKIEMVGGVVSDPDKCSDDVDWRFGRPDFAENYHACREA
jgi:hypothetical protein